MGKTVLYISYNGATEPVFQSQVLPYLKRLTARGSNIMLLTFERLSESTPQELEMLRLSLSEVGIAWTYLRYHKQPRVPATLFDIARGTIAAVSLIRRYNIKFIHARSYIPAIIASFAAGWHQVPWLFDMRGLMADEYADGGLISRNGRIFRIIKRIEKYLLRTADEVVVLTENIKGVLSSLTSAPMEVIPCCVDTQIFKPSNSTKNEKTELVYAGSTGTWYCLEEMAEFFNTWKAFNKKVHWSIFSQGDLGTIRDTLRDKNVQDEDVEIQAVPYESMPASLVLGDVGIAFMKSTFSKRASCPIKVAEYLACGLPVVINAGIGDTEDLIERNRVGVVVRDFSPAGYAMAIGELSKLRKDPDLSARCRRVTQGELSIQMGVHRYQEVYRRMETANA